MKNTISISLLALLILPVTSWGQDAETTLPSAPSSQIAPRASGDISDVDHGAVDPPSSSVPIDPNPARPAPATAAEFGLSNKPTSIPVSLLHRPSVRGSAWRTLPAKERPNILQIGGKVPRPSEETTEMHSRSASAFRPRDSLLEPLPGKIHVTSRPPATTFCQGASTQSASLLSIARILDIACPLYPTLWEPLQVDSSAIPIFQPVSTM